MSDETCAVIEGDRVCGAPAYGVIEGCGCGDPDCDGDIPYCENHGRQIGLIQE